MRLRRGFTLLEMTLVLLIAAIVFAMVLPSMDTLGRDPEEGQPWKEVADLLRSSRKLSLERAVTVRVVLDPYSGIFRVDSTGPRGAGIVSEGQLEMGLNLHVEADSTRTKFAFMPDGSAFADSLIVISSGYATKISVEPFTGEVKIEER